MHPRYRHRDHHGLQDLDDLLELQRLGRQILAHRLDAGYQIQHPLDVEHHLDVGHRLDEERLTDLDVRQQRRLDEEHHLDEGHGPCPGWS